MATLVAVVFFAGCFFGMADENNPNSFLRREAEAYLEAYMARDYDVCLQMMGGTIVDALGGKIRVLNHFHATEEALKLHRLTLENMTVDEPRAVVKQGANDRFVVIPERHIYVSRDGNRYVLDSYILAVSGDAGRTWNMFEGNWRVSEHIKNHDFILYDKLKLPIRKIYLADDPRLMMVEKGGSFITPPETIKYKQSLRQRGNVSNSR